jgi:molecular chaperone GrpE
MTTDDVSDNGGQPDAIDAELAELLDGDGSTIEAVEPSPLEAMTAERDQFKDMALRIQADFENYRKRVASQQADEIDRATGRNVESLLPVLDACEAAFAHGAEAVEPIWSALLGVLQKQGLEVLDLADQPFDPSLADAVAHEPGDGDPVVAEVLRTGYRWKNRVLRAAMVRVKG